MESAKTLNVTGDESQDAHNSSKEELIIPQMLKKDPSPPPSRSFRFTCNECNKSFVTRYKLTRHQFVHKPAGAKPLKCTWVGCEKRFRARYDRNRHMMTHTGERPFVCNWPQCSKRFSRADKLKSHQRKHYQVMIPIQHWPEFWWWSQFNTKPEFWKHDTNDT